MKSVTFCFATHNHQPLGNFDYVIEEAFEKSYKPFFEVATKYPIRFSTHFSGILLQWLLSHHPEYIAKLRELVLQGKIELIGGGYYEPILAVISNRDKQCQIDKLSDFISEHFSTRPTGLWLAERVWEQQLSSRLVKAGMKYVILDDTHFRSAGLHSNDLNGYYLTEDSAKTLAVFPISKELRYTIPFQSVDETIHVLRDAASSSGDSIISFADDGEKFGVWPNTYSRVYEEGWLEELFAKLSEGSSWIKMKTFSEVLAEHRPNGRIYLPNASYAEMMEWSLPKAETIIRYEQLQSIVRDATEQSSEYEQFIRGGFWRNFFVKYPESNHLHKRMLFLSERLAPGSDDLAYTHILAAQCNDSYWHGVFGGIYLPNLRHEAYRELLSASQEQWNTTTHTAAEVTITDFNCDGVDDVILETNTLLLCIDPSRGGAISEISYKPKAFNLTNFINRIPEAYHEKIRTAAHSVSTETASIHDIVAVKEEGLDSYLIYDWYRHGSFIEHFLSAEATVDDLASQEFLDHSDFFKSHQSPAITEQDKQVTISFEREGLVSIEGASTPVLLKKSLTTSVDTSEILCQYELTNNSSQPIELRFASEWTFGLLTGDAHDRYYQSSAKEFDDLERQLRSKGELAEAKDISLVDEWGGFRIDLESSEAATIWRAPIESVASSEAGFERLYQGSILFWVWNFALLPKETWSVRIRLGVKNLSEE